eukprot:4650093-Amphidinium_carterae.1
MANRKAVVARPSDEGAADQSTWEKTKDGYLVEPLYQIILPAPFIRPTVSLQLALEHQCHWDFRDVGSKHLLVREVHIH